MGELDRGGRSAAGNECQISLSPIDRSIEFECNLGFFASPFTRGWNRRIDFISLSVFAIGIHPKGGRIGGGVESGIHAWIVPEIIVRANKLSLFGGRRRKREKGKWGQPAEKKEEGIDGSLVGEKNLN